ncbi:MAG TPA: PilT/PilU family type 4a pilus ATPase [Planctomycetota bacterium]|nr:PilT/PilU family type 4a pilus ATPase [Planctomycetota bacterium]
MQLSRIVELAARHGASDLHVAAGRPVLGRVRGELRPLAGAQVAAADTEAMARELLPGAEWERFRARGSADLALDVGGVRCRVNLLHSAGHVGLALRLLPGGPVSLESLNLHPDLATLVEPGHGLVLVSGPTGCGKSSTLAALVQEVNRTRAAHIVTIEQPVEFELQAARSFIRQREVGRDTPSFEQALLDSLREDIDVLMVGEMRDRETMRLTLDACETGHLVLATLHSSTVIEALQRVVSAFPAQEQPSVCAQLAENLIAVVSQRLVWRDDPGLRVPECEILVANTAVQSILRQGQFFKLGTAMETGGRSRMWTLARYRQWIESRADWTLPGALTVRGRRPPGDAGVIEIQPDERSLSDIVSELEKEG